MGKIILGFSLLLCCAVVQGLVCYKCNPAQLCHLESHEKDTCVAKQKYPWCFTVATYIGNITYTHYGCANFEPCTSWEPILDQGRYYIKKCCNTDYCNGLPVVDANRPAPATAST